MDFEGRPRIPGQEGRERKEGKKHTLGNFFNQDIQLGIRFLGHHSHIVCGTQRSAWTRSRLSSCELRRCNVSVDFAMVKQLL